MQLGRRQHFVLVGIGGDEQPHQATIGYFVFRQLTVLIRVHLHQPGDHIFRSVVTALIAAESAGTLRPQRARPQTQCHGNCQRGHVMPSHVPNSKRKERPP
ncbi:hypothetical protein C5Y97_29420 [Blastopirellula marina]|uniref:Uncharacterized protein n=1 Tax=Blastopirellula marina TaxID=124 RepID=A0A2S8F412_9BACT|nr:hypothetical protein C5Y98_29405 [Blastopirellula marina]PQO41578.1 hypothetical protein C5Y93_31200 [Blastopirellula marina]PTL41097.1 hypothetical protein C5Y97_29420 [Blastopirellula marina]